MIRSRETPLPAIDSDGEKPPNSSLKTLWFDFQEVPLFSVDAIPDLPIETIIKSRVLRRPVWLHEKLAARKKFAPHEGVLDFTGVLGLLVHLLVELACSCGTNASHLITSGTLTISKLQ